MTIVLATIAIIFLMMPGFAFVAGVNISDKNVREIVFRGTPAELAYVVTVSLIVHLAFSGVPMSFINSAKLIDRFGAVVGVPAAQTLPPGVHISDVVRAALVYFSASALAGGILGLALGLAVRKNKWKYFIKHRWMTMLIGLSNEKDTVYAYAVLSPSFAQGKGIAEPGQLTMASEPGNGATVIRGWVRDSYFDFNGTLLYLVFGSFQDMKVNLSDAHWLAALADDHQSMSNSPRPSEGRLVIEGRNVALVQYEPVPLKVSASEIRAAISAGETGNS
jgi:hypothetical protein